MLTTRFDEAFAFAHRLHRLQTRKGAGTPYIAHLMSVAALVVEHGGDSSWVCIVIEVFTWNAQSFFRVTIDRFA